MPVILAAQETEIRKVLVQSLPSKKFLRPYQKKKKKPIKKNASAVTEVVRALA
jgi:hypothetical protein